MVQIDNNLGVNLNPVTSSKGKDVKDDTPKLPTIIDESVHIYYKDGEVVKVENRDDKDGTLYVYDDGKLIGKLAPGSEVNL